MVFIRQPNFSGGELLWLNPAPSMITLDRVTEMVFNLWKSLTYDLHEDLFPMLTGLEAPAQC